MDEQLRQVIHYETVVGAPKVTNYPGQLITEQHFVEIFCSLLGTITCCPYGHVYAPIRFSLLIKDTMESFKSFYRTGFDSKHYTKSFKPHN